MRILSILGSVAAGVVMTASVAYAAGGLDTAAVPEPGTLALLATGITGLAGASWWLRRK